MKRRNSFWAILLLFLGTVHLGYAQEQESAELFLDEYTDEFQDSFFEALKQKSIQNYDRAINLFFACKELDPTNDVIDYQLAKTYSLDKQYVQAQEYAIEALSAKPADFWYLENLVNIMEAQNSPLENLGERIPLNNLELKQNLALIYFKKAKYADALHVLESMGNSRFANELSLKIRDSMDLKDKRAKSEPIENKPQVEDNPISQYKGKMEELLTAKDFSGLEQLALEALEVYPLQAYFHYAYGAALNGKSNTGKSIEVLEGALDYLFDDDALANKIYRELAKAYNAIGNPTKATEYLNKVKPGL